ncbi:MAG: PKD domain-containing protein [Desulfobacteraceae bacterium]|nr:PKD domain-containing protein [Desulfobacteraceae bacterium]
MKKVYLLWMMLFLLSTNLQAASNDAFFFEGEGQITPTLQSQELLDANLLPQNNGNIAVNIVSGGFPDIVAHLTVSDINGKPISGLTATDFALAEKSETETAPVNESLTCFEENITTTPISLALVFDVSGSMGLGNRLSDAKTAAINFLNKSQAGDKASLVTFSGCDQGGIIIPIADIKNDGDQNGTPDIVDAIQSLSTLNRTAVYDGIGNGIDSISQEAFPKGVIVFTDGNTNDDCHYSINEVIQKAKDKGIPVYTIGLQSSIMSAQLKTIAASTGGYYREAPTALEMETLYTDIAQSIRGQYTLCYTTHNPVQDGTLRTVTVNYEGKSGSGSYTAPGVLNPNPPVINHTPVTTWQENLAIPISAEVTDPDAGDSISRVSLFYRIAGSNPDATYASVDMTNTSGNGYGGVIPANMVTLAGVQYYLAAWDARGGQAENGSAAVPHFIQVTAASPPPVANAGPDASVREGDIVTLDGSASLASTADGVLSYAWRQLSGTTVTLSSTDNVRPVFTAPFTGPEGADLVFELKVTDSANKTGSDTVTITVNDFLAPEASFTWSPASPAAGQSVTFTDGSTPKGGNIVSWEWKFDEEGTASVQNPQFTFTKNGDYTVRLTVRDEFGSVGTATKTVTVSCPGGDCGGSGGCFIQSAGAAFMME